MSTVLIAGCGDVGIRLASLLISEGHVVWGLRRDVTKLPMSVQGIAADLRNSDSLRLPCSFQYVIFLPSADVRSDSEYHDLYVAGVRHLYSALGKESEGPCRVFYVSSTSVYGQNDGQWVDELSPARPTNFTGRRLLEGEGAAASGDYPCTVVRFAGIYGPGRTRLVERIRVGTTCQVDPPIYTNRIYSDDCARVLVHLMNLPQPEKLYIGVDEEPTPQCVVMNWIAGQLGVAPPRPIFAGKDEENRLNSGNKRCSNRRLKGSGFKYLYPTFKDGYAEIL